MAKRKNFKDASSNAKEPNQEASSKQKKAAISLDIPALTYRNIDLTDWLNQGIDEWVFTCISLYRRLLDNKSVAASTVISYHMAFLNFFRFITQFPVPFKPDSISRPHIDEYIRWLQFNDRGWSPVTQKVVYSGTKSVITSMQRYGLAAGDRSIFPRNPFPGSNGKGKGERELSENERLQLAQMLRKEIIAIHKGTFEGVEGEELTILATAFAMRTGLNQTPLLELRRDSLRPHPFMPSMMMLESFKRRGNATHLTSLRYSASTPKFTSVQMDGVALLKMVLSRNQKLADESKDETIRQSIWIYRQAARKREITLLSTKVMARTIQRYVDKNGLTSDGGGRLFINVSRLRKTLENRLWALSGGDIISVSSIMGHTPDVADTHYLSCNDEIRRNATFVGEALPDLYRGKEDRTSAGDASSEPLQNTPVGSCRDTMFGEHAPKDGIKHCSDFLSCFSCRSYAIVGSAKDLHRLFSFYWFLQAELEKGRSSDWLQKYQHALDLIDTFTVDKFDPIIVAQAKSAAKEQPIKFWKTYQTADRRDN